MIVVTGGAGFIGSNLVAGLEERGERDVVVCDGMGSGDQWKNLAKRDLADVVLPEDLGAFLQKRESGVRALFHMAAITSTTESDADLVLRTNVQLSSDLWSWCARHQVPFIYASSAATYGDGAEGFDDDGSPQGLARLRPLNLYGWSKHLFDRMVARRVAEGRARPPQWAGLKFFNVYGPNEYHKGAMQSFVAKAFGEASAGQPVTLFRSHHPDYPDGGQMRDFIWVRDCVSVMLWLLDHPEVSGLYNLGTGAARTFLDVVRTLGAALGRETAIGWVDTPAEIRDQYQYFTQAETVRLRAAGYREPFLSLEEGVDDYVRGYLATEDPYR